MLIGYISMRLLRYFDKSRNLPFLKKMIHHKIYDQFSDKKQIITQ